MQRGDVFLVERPSREDPRRRRAVVVVSRSALADTRFASVVCAPVYSRFDGIDTQVEIGPESGLQHTSSVYCDNLLSIPKRQLTNFVGTLSGAKMRQVSRALAIALDIAPEDIEDL